MSKRKYEQVQTLLPEIKTMVTAGKIQREIAEHFPDSVLYWIGVCRVRLQQSVRN